MLVYLNMQITPFPENPTPHDYTGLHGIEQLHLQSLGQLQLLFDPDIVVQLFFNSLKGTIRLVRVLDDKLSLKLILELPNEFCEKIEWDHWSMEAMEQYDTHQGLGWLVP